jgi:seryl-tRNA synthetase
MLDLRWLVENLNTAKEKLQKRNFPTDLLDSIVSEDNERRSLIQKTETIRARRNQIAKDIGQKKRSGEDVTALMNESTKIGEESSNIEVRLGEIQQKVDEALLRIPNLPHDSVPDGKDEKDNREVRRHGEPKKLSFQAQDHYELGIKLGILDFDRATRLASTRFSALLGKGAKLERSLINFMLDLHTEEHGYKEMLPPFLANTKSFIGTSQLPKFKEDQFKVEGHDLYLVPTAEVPVTNFHREELLEEADLPYKYTAYTPCFRSEAGSYGRDTRGLIRQHQFEKVELVMLCHPDKSWELHELLVSHAEEVLKRLELPYRTMLLCTGDMGFGAAKCYDLEVWLPGQNAYREISSCSNFLDFQARRASIRYRPKDGSKPRFVHTLNGSGLAVGRTLLAILENFQQEDGSVLIPKALQKYTGFDRIESSK